MCISIDLKDIFDLLVMISVLILKPIFSIYINPQEVGFAL